MLEKLKLILGITSDDEDIDTLLQLYLTMAEEDAANRYGINDITPVSNTIVRMAEYLYNRQGTAGLTSEQYSAATYHYEVDYPDYLLAALKNYADSIMEGGKGWLKTY